MKKTITAIIFFTLSLCLTTFSFAFSKADLQALESRASKGDMQAQSDLGYRYYMGDGVAKDPTKAFNWHLKAAQQGDALAQTVVGLAYLKGDGIKKDGNKALQWLLKAAEQGNAHAMNSTAVIYYEKGNYTTAADWFTKAALLDHRAAQYQLGKMYFEGTGVKQDFDKALPLLTKSASLGYIPAVAALGAYFEDRKELSHAKEFYQIACDLGSQETLNAQETIGMQEACSAYKRLNAAR